MCLVGSIWVNFSQGFAVSPHLCCEPQRRRQVVRMQVAIARIIHCLFIFTVGIDMVMMEKAPASDADLQMFLDKYWAWRLDQSPEFATRIGEYVNQDKLQQLTEEAFMDDKTQAESLLAEGTSLDQAKFSPQGRLTLRAVTTVLKAFIDGYAYRRYTQFNPITPLDYPTRDWDVVISKTRLEDENDYRNLTARYRHIAGQLPSIITLMRKAITANTTLHNSSLTGTDDKLAALLADMANHTSIFHKPFYNMPESLSADLRSELTRDAFAIIEDDISPAVTAFRRFISEEYSPHTRPQPGISSLPGGAAVYDQCLQWHLGLPLTAEQVHQMGREEVERIYGEMDKLRQADGYSGTVSEYLAHLKLQPKSYYPSEEAMLDAYSDIAKRVHDHLPKVLDVVHDNCPFEVVQNMNPQGWARYNSISKDRKKPGQFVINVFNPETRPKFGMTALTLHELEPGHHTMSCTNLDQASPYSRYLAIEYRKYYAVPFNFPFFTSVSEGWALYAEGLGEEMGIYTEKHSLLGRYISEIFRAARLVVDTGLHAKGWSQQEAVTYLSNYSTRSLSDMENEVNRYISWPGQACSYKVGELKIKELRNLAKEKLGDRFDLKKFNTRVLELGVLPLALIQEEMESWIDEQGVNSVLSTASMTSSTATMTIVMLTIFITSTWNIPRAL